jgi:protein-tyrosine phosphatase
MGPDIYQVSSIGQGRFFVMTKPFSGEWINEEFDAIRALGIWRVVSLLECAGENVVGLTDEYQQCRSRGIDFIHYELPDRGIPSNTDKYLALIQFLHDELVGGKDTVVHCRAGIGRTGMVATAILIKYGFSSENAFKLVSEARRVSESGYRTTM